MMRPEPGRVRSWVKWGAGRPSRSGSREAALAALVLILGCTPGSEPADSGATPQVDAGAATPSGAQDQTAYQLGVLLGRGLSQLALSDAERASLEAGLRDQGAGRADIDMVAVLPELTAFQQARSKVALERERAAGAAWVAAQSKQDGVEVLDSGVVVQSISEGAPEGASPVLGDAVLLRFEVRLPDGLRVDGSDLKGGPQLYPLGGLLPCWSEVLPRVRVEGKVRVWCPPDLAFGPMGRPPLVPPGAAVETDLELVDVRKGGAASHGARPYVIPRMLH